MWNWPSRPWRKNFLRAPDPILKRKTPLTEVSGVFCSFWERAYF